ncbi:MAG TPA: D-glycero-beta-D-manno-heptose-7-phosphate kinase [Ktedonobacteraceae bacterium]|jgi:rfaE bifunctional protein kinase chain/domain|nr:D-glycero-beta-D-manno-heptose-7-phosphate kinase [Ktedonobacteraceae bacterium]
MRVEELMETVPGRHILVAGDVMLDEYLWGNVHRMSPEAPVPVVAVERQSHALGGAGNVAANLAALGCRVSLVGVVGTDAQATEIAEILALSPNIIPYLYPCQDRPTTIKTRIIVEGKQLLRADREEKRPIPTEAEEHILAYIQEQLPRLHACVLSDYAKGTLTEKLINSAILLCKQARIPVIVDPKGHRYSRYRGATVVTPNLAEAHLAVDTDEAQLTLEEVAGRLLGDICDGALLITQGARGMSLFRRNSRALHIPAEARIIYDVTGAGDTVVAVLALSLALGMDLEMAARLANYAAGIVVGKVGTASVSLEELCAGFERLSL